MNLTPRTFPRVGAFFWSFDKTPPSHKELLKQFKALGFTVAQIGDPYVQDLIDNPGKRKDFVRDFQDAGVDITPHPKDRVPIVREAILAGKHVLSQKPFVLDIAEGKELVDLAREKGKPAFESLRHLVLYDFAIHWFDILTCFMGDRRAESVFAAICTFPGQVYGPPSQASVIAQYPGAQARMGFNAHTVCGEEDSTTIIGTRRVLRARGSGLNAQNRIEWFTPEGTAIIPLEGEWFKSGLQGTMGELLSAIEQKREPYHSAANNLASLELCFAAMASAESNLPVKPGSVSRIEKA